MSTWWSGPRWPRPPWTCSARTATCSARRPTSATCPAPLKHFFDGIYYPCLSATQRRPYALYVHGNSDTGGAVRAVESIATGLGWRRSRPPVTVLGEPSAADREACWELGATVAAELAT